MRRVRQPGAARHQEAMRFAFPPALVGILEPSSRGDQNRIGWISDIPDLVGLAAEGASM